MENNDVSRLSSPVQEALAALKSRQRKTERHELPGTPFSIEISEIRSASKLSNIDTEKEERKEGIQALSAQIGVALNPSAINWFTWLEQGITGFFKDGEKVADSLTFDEIALLAEETKDALIDMGVRVRILTHGDFETKKAGSEPQKEAGQESSLSNAGGSEELQENSTPGA